MQTGLSKNLVASILVSQIGLPSNLMGSWTQILEYMLCHYPVNKIDYLLSGTSTIPFQSQSTKRIICNSLKWEINRDWYYPLKYRSYIKALTNIIAINDFAVIVVMDNPKLKNIVTDTIEKNGWQKKCRVIFIQCGFSYEFTRDEYRDFRKGLHEIVLLTQKSYEYERNKYHEYPFLVHVLHNPVRQDIFYKISDEEKKIKRHAIGIDASDKMFLWISHDRPKKGLDIILNMWPAIVAKYPTAKLIIVGAQREISLPGMRFEGKLPNAELAKYYQAADVFLFSSLCQEGFGLSLAEAMSCGCFCIASDVGGVNEFFNADNGILINDPNKPEAWITAINKHVTQQYNFGKQMQVPFLTYDEWCSRFQQIISGSIQFLIQSANR
jgi:L-malate glycosyltransferase